MKSLALFSPKMDDSGSFSSLLALVDDHLSKTRIQAVSRPEETGSQITPGFNIPSLHGLQNSTQSESSLPQLSGQRLPIPSLGLSQSPIKNVLAEQIANMLKAKERKQKEEEDEKLRQKLETMKVKDSGGDCVIDLVKALSTPFERNLPPSRPPISSSSSTESLFEPPLIDFASEFDIDTIAVPEPLLPCSTDMTFILKHKIPKGKCSSFGKILISRYKTTAAPYFREKLNSDIVRFDFKTKSPCDLIKEKLRKTGYNTFPTEFSPELKLL